MATNILLLEDDPFIRDVLTDVLADEGHDVHVCESVRHVLDGAAESPGALAVVDFWGDSHQELAADERAQVLQLTRSVPTIFVTARTWARSETVRELGFLAVVRKPFDVDALVAVIAAALDGGQRVGLG